MVMGKLHCHLHPLLSFYTLVFIVWSFDFFPTMLVGFDYQQFSDSDVTRVSTYKDCPEQSKTICLFGDAYFNVKGEIDLQDISGGTGAIYSKQIQLWNMQTDKTADFTTEFSFKFTSTNYSYYYPDGELWFIMSTIPLIQDWNAYLGVGLVTKSDDLKQNKVRLQIVSHSIKKQNNKVETTLPIVYQNDPYGHVRVHYDSINSFLTVSVGYKSLPTSIILSHAVDLKTLLPENVSIAFSDVPYFYDGVRKITSWSFSSIFKHLPDQQSISVSTRLVVGVVIGLVLLLALLGFAFFVMKHKTKEQTTEGVGGNTDIEEDWILDAEFENEQNGPKKLSYSELEKATDNFNPKRKLGEGGFGPVYNGFLKYQNKNVAIKRISGHSKQGRKEYIAEVKIISQLRHKNMVQLIGWCHENGELLLVYELMENGSLDSFIFDHTKSLSWPIRYKITKGLAAALIYLHQEWKQCVVHRDVKAGNVMLDKSFDAKLGDFGLARLSDHGSSVQTTFMAGTMGYIAPESLMTGKGSKESDVYAFGIVVLEIVCGRKCIDHNSDESKVRLVEWVWKMYGYGSLLEVVDERILNDEDYNEKQVKQLLMVGLCCAHPDLEKRPSMSHALAILNFQGSLPTLSMEMPRIGFTAARQQSNISFTTDTTSTSTTSFMGTIELSNIR